MAVLVANRAFGLYNSRPLLAEHLNARGYEVYFAANFESDPTPHGTCAPVSDLHVPIARSRLGAPDVVVVAQLVRAFRRLRPSLVHNFNLKAAVLSTTAARLARGRNTTVINTVTGLGHVFIANSRLRGPAATALRITARLSDAIVFQNPTDASLLGTATASGRQHVILGSGVDTDRFHPRRGGRRPGPLRVFAIARITHQKGVLEYLRAASTFVDDPRVSFHIAGELDVNHPDAVDPDRFRRLLHESGVEYLGFRADIADVLRDADLVVVPSYREGFSRAVLEAHATGALVIASDVPGCREGVEVGVDGWLVPPRDSKALTAALAAYLDMDPNDRDEMTFAARDAVCKRFSLRSVTGEYLALYDSLGV